MLASSQQLSAASTTTSGRSRRDLRWIWDQPGHVHGQLQVVPPAPFPLCGDAHPGVERVRLASLHDGASDVHDDLLWGTDAQLLEQAHHQRGDPVTFELEADDGGFRVTILGLFAGTRTIGALLLIRVALCDLPFFFAFLR